MKHILISAAFATFSFNAFAADMFSAGPSWDYVEAGYQQAEIDDAGDFEPKGYALAASKAIGENFFLKANYSDLSEEESGLDTDLSQFSAGVGYRYSATKTTDVYGVVSFERIEIEASAFGESVEADDDGFGIEAGIRSMIIDQLELSAAVKHIEMDEGDTGFVAGANFYITPAIAVGASYEMRDDIDFLGADIRYSF
ncbi:outer membrane beta-barrel protein [Salinimonas sediminis]|uniref:Porin family protein n=1 Tax=Salinimonas sediminis TaxID=2303538 RepID=A0A346NPJ1_9ALTE|nr:outer membrane beta-barrel protein [Salinimonas sediminis]AXR07448.1 porin family protein [Salinimonas sediminis]